MYEVNPMSFVGSMAANMVRHEMEKEKQAKETPVATPVVEDEYNRLEIDLGFTKLVAERCDDGSHVGFVIGMYDAQGDWQDICYVEADPETFKDSRYLRCFVWGNSQSEDWTNKFIVGQYKANENK